MTREEIVTALRCCADDSGCDACPYEATADSADVGGGVSDGPRWCEDCRYFESLDPTGEGECKASKPKADVWYGRVACENFQRKEVSP